jgi:uncharacterized protein YkwD
LLTVLLLPTSALAAPCRGANAEPTRSTIPQARAAVRCLLNDIRRDRGLRKLRGNRLLRIAAKRHSVDMNRRNFFDHVAPGGLDMVARIVRAGYLRSGMHYTVGENLGWGQSSLATPRAMVRAWMESPGHRANILQRRWKHVGIGIAIGTPRGGDGVTYTTNFGRRS